VYGPDFFFMTKWSWFCRAYFILSKWLSCIVRIYPFFCSVKKL